MRVRLGLAVILFSVFALASSGFSVTTGVTGANAMDTSWTIMVYMADDYPVTLSWQDDINEMEAAQQAPGTNIIALVDEYGPNNSFILKVAHDPNFLNDTIVSERLNDSGAVITTGEVNMAQPSTLSSFIRFCVESYPADRLVLDLWGHGDSWRGLCPDVTDILTLPELKQGLSQASLFTGRSLDIIVVDSCAEASMEMLTQLRGLTTIFVGSEKDVPYQGLPYVLVMNDLASAPSQGPVSFGTRIAEDYVTWSVTNSDYSTTMGVFNVTRIGQLLADLNALSSEGSRYDQLFHQAMRETLDSTEYYEEQYRVDMGDLMTRLSKANLPLELKYWALACVIDAAKMIEHSAKFSNIYAFDTILATNATGMTVYAASTDPVDLPYGDLDIAATSWLGFGESLRNDTITQANGPGPSVARSPSMLYDPAIYPEPPIDTATLKWSGYEVAHAEVFRFGPSGLNWASSYEQEGDTIEFMDPGSLTIAASADIGGHAASYVQLNLSLEGLTTIRVRLLEDGTLVPDVQANYKVKIVRGDGLELNGSYAPAPNGAYISRLMIPNDAEVGEHITIEVRTSSGRLVGLENSTVPLNPATIEVQIWSPRTTSGNLIIPIFFIALPAVLLLAFAGLMYNQQRKRTQP